MLLQEVIPAIIVDNTAAIANIINVTNALHGIQRMGQERITV